VVKERRALFASLGLFALALVPRLYVALAWTREPVWDGHYYDIGARSIAAGRGYVGVEGGPWCHYPVGYSAWLGLAYRLFGTGAYVGPLLNALMGALSAMLVYELGRRASEPADERRAFLAGVLVAVHPGLIAYTPLLMTETTSAWLVLVAPVLLTAGSSAWKRSVLGGAVFGLAALVRPQSLLCAPAAAWLAARAGTRRVRMISAVLSTAAALVVVAPWTVRNCVVMDGCALVSTNGGWNLAIGSFPRATGRFETLRGSDGCTIVTGQVQQDRCWSERAAAWISADPLRWLALVPKKLSFTFDHESFAIGYLGEADPARWPEARKENAREFLSGFHRALMMLAPLAFVGRPSRKEPLGIVASVAVALLGWIGIMTDTHPFWPLALALVFGATVRARTADRDGASVYAAYVVATLILVHAVFFGEDRYHLVASPLLCLLVAYAWRAPRRADASAAVAETEEASDRPEEANLLAGD